MKKLAILVAMLLLLIPFSLAYEVTVPEETIKTKAISETKIWVKIASPITDTITATIQDAKPWMSLNESQFTVRSGTVKTINLVITPFEDVILGTYGVPILFKSVTTGEEKRDTIFISVIEGDVLVIDKMLITGNLEPLGSAQIQVMVKNYKPVSVESASLFVRVKSPPNIILNEFTKVLPVIDPGETETATFNIFFDKGAPSGNYEVFASLRNMQEVVESTQNFNVHDKSVIQREAKKSPTLFGFERTIILTNNGNVAGEDVVTDYLSYMESMFFSGDSPTLKSSGVYTWVVRDIKPGETRYIVYRIDYTPIFACIVAVIIGAWILFFKLKTIRLRKYIIQRKKIEAGDEFTIAVEVSNRLGGKFEVNVNDFVPAVFDVKEGEGPKPVKKKSHSGTELSWHVKDLHSNEARILTYKIVPVFGVKGILRLPKASADFKIKGRKFTNKSGSPILGLTAEMEGKSRMPFRTSKKKK